MEDTGKISDKGKGKATSHQKATDFLKIGSQAAEQQRLRNNLEADQRSMSRSQDLKIKQDKHSMPKHRDANLQVTQAIWGGIQRQADHVASNSRQRPHDLVKQVWRPIQHSSSMSSLSKRPFNTGPKEITALAGGGDPNESSSQQQTTKEKNAESKEMLNEVSQAYETNKTLYGGNEGYAFSQTKEAFNSHYQKALDAYQSMSQKGLTKNQMFDKIDKFYPPD